MFERVKLARPGLSVDARHDGRHRLERSSLQRESIPFTVALPDEGLAIVTYTWVNGNSEAGAAIALFGSAIGDRPIEARLPDRSVPVEMDFSDWRIDEFQIKQDLKFGHAEVHWHGEQAKIDFEFEGFHPPYSYASNAQGCPRYCATDRIEQSGRARGTVRIGQHVIDFDTNAHRDHSWGTRDWKAFQNYRWFNGQVGTEAAVHFWHLHALGRTEIYGYVYKDGLMAEVTKVDVDWSGDSQFRHGSARALVFDEAGRQTVVNASFFAHYPLIPDPVITLMEGAARVTIDGRHGVGWMEMGWETDYLRHIIAESRNY